MIQRAAFYSRQRGGNRNGANRQGFTLIEILVVLAIAAIISSVTLGGFNEMRAGNKRVACSTNLSQLYQAARLYAADEGGKFPHFEADCSVTPATNSGIGLWSLYTFPNGRVAPAADEIALVGAPVERYLRSSKTLHCPADLTEDSAGYSNENLFTSDGSKLNPGYLSYQTCDTLSTPAVSTYASQRINSTTDMNLWKRQLLHFEGTNFVGRQPTGDTVVTYCLHHRSERNMDNVLFYDGSIQLLPVDQGGLTDWKRIPKDPQ